MSDARTDAFHDLFGGGRGRPARRQARRAGGHASSEFSGLVAACVKRPKDPARVTELVAELRAHWGDTLGTPAANEPRARLAVASLRAGTDAALRAHARTTGRRSAAGRAGHAELALARARVVVLAADLCGPRADLGPAVLDSAGQKQGQLSGRTLEAHTRHLSEARELVASADAR